jgi:hypothetical protein
MKTNAIHHTDEQKDLSPAFKRICLASCRKLLAQVETSKTAILAEFRNLARGQEQMLRLAVNEAEALAWQTDYPHLVFPTLAKEKAEAVVAWKARERAIRQTPFMAALAA